MTDAFKNIAVTSFPDITKVDFKSIENQYLKVILINTFVAFLVLFLGICLGDYKGLLKFIENTVYLL
jgi:predicted ABC-type exoprotein transport system permease subunit